MVSDVDLHPFIEGGNMVRITNLVVAARVLRSPAAEDAKDVVMGYLYGEVEVVGRDALPARVIGRHYITERDSAPVQYNGIV